MSEETKNDGGPAFPCNTGQGYYVEGMSLRDWFAGRALPSIVSASIQMAKDSCGEEVRTNQQIVEWAYILADAMIAESEK